MKTPLTSAREFIAILLDGLSGPVTDEQRQFLGLAKDSCDQMTRYINDLLDTTRIETGKLNVQLEAVELQPLLERVAASFRPSMKEKEIVIRLNAPHTPLVACLDTTRITQVLNNLLSNARKYTPPGPGSDRFSSRVWA